MDVINICTSTVCHFVDDLDVCECLFLKESLVFINRSISGYCFQTFLEFSPCELWGFMIQFDDHIFQMGWFHHQLVDGIQIHRLSEGTSAANSPPRPKDC